MDVERLLLTSASGYRHRDNGSLYDQGSIGWYWSSTVNNADRGYNCYFDLNGTINPENANERSNGFSVRCVQAFTKKRYFCSLKFEESR